MRGSNPAALLAVLLSMDLVAPVCAAEGQRPDLVNRTALRVCADPANMPFSNDKNEGFENKIAEIVAAELKFQVEYTWFPQATGFIRQTLLAKRCDVVIGYARVMSSYSTLTTIIARPTRSCIAPAPDSTVLSALRTTPQR